MYGVKKAKKQAIVFIIFISMTANTEVSIKEDL